MTKPHVIDMERLTEAFARCCIRIYEAELTPGKRVTDSGVMELHALAQSIVAVNALQRATLLERKLKEDDAAIVTPATARVGA